jgi:hypothetical protein
VRTKAQNGFGFDFFEQCHKDGDEFLNPIVRVTGDETWVSFVNVETKEQSSVVNQKADGTCFLGQERNTGGGIHATGDHKNVKSVLRNTKRKAQGHSEQTAWNADVRCSACP